MIAASGNFTPGSPSGVSRYMDNETDANDLLVESVAKYLSESMGRETSLRDLLAQAGYNDPKMTVERCVEKLVHDHLRTMSV